MKVALVQPNNRRSVATGGYVFKANPPLGLCYLSAVLKQNGIECIIIDANAFNYTPEQVAEKVKGYDIVGVSILSPAYTFATNLVKLLPKEVIKVAGNAHPTGYFSQVLNDGFDIVAIGEGEYTLLEIAQKKPLEEILGIAYKDVKGIHINQPRLLLKDPSVLPFPDREALVNNGMDDPYLSFMTQKTPYAAIFTSRGCPFNCYYCNKLTFGVSWRPRTAENVFAEIKELVEKYHVKEIDICDDAFNVDLKRAKKICDMIIEAKYKLIIRCTNGLRADFIDEEFLQKMKKAGCNYIAFGVESGNQEVLDKIPKCETLETIEKAFTLTRKAGIKTAAFVIFGLEGDTEKTMQDTIDFTSKKLKPNYASVSIMTPYPGTRLYDKIKKSGRFVVPEDWSYFSHTNPKMLFEHPDFPSPELTEKMFKKCFREFYMNPSFIIRNVISIRNWFEFKQSLTGFKAIMSILKKKVRE
jgi:anaerobic magnesium-protoporphyrin IX monomethyl ester cyclase